ncbi:enoyl-CoA hydratase/isomerase family protein [Pseudoglutamicibacter albus]|uniref:enoyl-CoA hydratase/isomerase family protein n=1 Tax=Pseudoglutamicibacter albus TaxID=98671 RepID=UPI0025432BFE|nr:enoyl-CoA hydratase/isomerase family protein [Pseudoglutamicibacter albus]WIK84577.1 enoyl-CoA hydratase/isomerase family protein [Pseudoglutamicibacter albus]
MREWAHMGCVDTGSELVLAERGGALGVITLNRPAAVNALNLKMVEAIHRALDAFATDDAVHAVMLRGAGERGLCAGGDVRVIYQGTLGDPAVAMDFFAAEYRLDYAISYFPKPFIPLMDGLVLGGGVGISVPGSHRIVNETSRVGMPEAGIGFSPDVGAAYFLARSPGAVGCFLSLTGLHIGAADALYAGLADAFVPSASWDALIAQLERVSSSAEVDDVVAGFAAPVTDAHEEAPGAGRLELARGWIDEVFSRDSVEEIFAALQDRAETAGNDSLEQSALDAMRRNSPTGMKTALEALKRARNLSLAETYKQDYRLCGNAVLGNRTLPAEPRGGASGVQRAGHDMREGIRAQIIDKDRNPQWKPATFEDVDADLVSSFFATVPGFPDLAFPDAGSAKKSGRA